MRPHTIDRTHLGLLASLAGILAWSAIRPLDYFIWFLEVAPALACCAARRCA